MKNYVITDILRARLIDYLEDKPAKEVITFLQVLNVSPTIEDFLRSQQENNKPMEVKKDG